MIKKKLQLVPHKPGCYLMKNKDGVIIYVGKAKNLKRRVSSYFRGTHYGKTQKLVSEIIDFDYIVVNSEIESLVLELNLIKKHDPKYNILLRDDKTYPYIELTDEKVPRLLIVRNINRKKNHTKLYGPYPDVTAARKTVNLLNRIYPLRKCTTYSKKPCLYFHIGECLGYCTNDVNEQLVDNMKTEIAHFLNGDHSFVTKKIKEEMEKESELLHYEKAKELKELLDYINIVLTKTSVEISDNVNRDIIGYYSDKGYLSIVVFFIRGSKLVGSNFKLFPIIDEIEEEVIRYIVSFYDKDIVLPKEILLPFESDLLEQYLNIPVKKPIKGDKKKLIDMAINNSKIYFDEKFELIKRDENKTIIANEELKEKLKLNKLDTIEIFDNSNLFGTFNVSGMVVFKNGLPSKKDYRKFKISVDKNDDYNTMKEVIYRRYFRVLKDNLNKPDLIIVDGGINQMNAARDIINELGLDIMVVGLKKNDKHNTSSLLAFEPIEEIEIDKQSNLFYYLERIQDEVHNFTINYHKQIRSKGSLESILDNVNGIGEKRKKELLKKYKSLTKLQELELNELESILPKEVAINLYNYLKDINL